MPDDASGGAWAAGGEPPERPPETYAFGGVEYTAHKVARLFPLIKGEAFDELVKDVEANGLRHPVVRRGTEIIDGRNRFRAALAAKVPVTFCDLKPGEHPVHVILTENIHVRSLSQSERAVIAAEVRRIAPGAFGVAPRGVGGEAGGEARAAGGEQPAKDGGTGSGAGPAGAARAEDAAADGDGAADPRGEPAGPAGVVREQEGVSAALGVSPEYTRQAERLREQAPELFSAVKNSDVTLRDAYAVREQPEDVRRQALEDVKAKRASTLVDAVERRTGRPPKARAAAPPKRPKAPKAPKAGDDAGRPALPPLPTAGDARAAAAPRRGAGEAQPAAPAADSSPPVPGPAARPAVAPAASAPASGPEERPAAGAPDGGGAPADAPADEAAGYEDVHPDLIVPRLLLACVRKAFGPSIDLDPCSNADAQDRIAAGEWYSAEQDGLSLAWRGAVWVFPPLALAPAFASKLEGELRAGNVSRAALLAPADLSRDWAGRLLRVPQFSALAVQHGRQPFEVSGDSRKLRVPGAMAVYLFGFGDAPAAGGGDALVHQFGVWGHVLRSVAGQPAQSA